MRRRTWGNVGHFSFASLSFSRHLDPHRTHAHHFPHVANVRAARLWIALRSRRQQWQACGQVGDLNRRRLQHGMFKSLAKVKKIAKDRIVDIHLYGTYKIQMLGDTIPPGPPTHRYNIFSSLMEVTTHIVQYLTQSEILSRGPAS